MFNERSDREKQQHFVNAYADTCRADSYAKLGFPNTYHLAYRDFPELFRQFVTGKRALDFGCGTGRSTRFLNTLGFQTTGIDISGEMIRKASEIDPAGDYRVVPDGDLSPAGTDPYDLILSVFTFDNIPGEGKRIHLMKELRQLLTGQGKLILLDSTPELYTHEWASFSTCMFHENLTARSGDIVRVIMKDVKDRRPVEDVLWTDTDYQTAFRSAGLSLICRHYTLANGSEPFPWISETKIAPWVIYILQKV
jgi:SAM-dependent methyltransferase